MTAMGLLHVYLPVTIVWTLANMLYLAWYFIGQRDERKIDRRLARFVAEEE